jgi:hypothetical protein
MHSALLTRNVNYTTLTPPQLLVEICHVLDSWHIVEDAGNNRSKSGLVELLQETIGIAAGEAYCMATVQSETGLVEALLQKTSNLPASEGCMDVWKQSEGRALLLLGGMSAAIQPGDIAVWKQLESDKGHTGRVVKTFPDGRFLSFEGNTSGGPGVDRDGAGCFMRERNRAPSGKLYLVGFIREQFT